MNVSSENQATPSILDLINRTLELPTIPSVLVKLNEVMADPEASAEDVAKVISLDPAVSTNILRIVNSAYYGLQVRVSSVNLAVSIMGFNMTKKVALKAAVFSVFAKKGHEKIEYFEPKAFWQHSIFTGVLARVLGQSSVNFAGIHPEDLYICGLLHDIGKIILLENATDDFARMLKTSIKEKRSMTEVEQEVLGFSHADVGSVLAIKWFLPEDLTIAIRYHHSPERDPFHKTLSSLICLADGLASKSGKPAFLAAQHEEPKEELYDLVGIDPENVEALISKTNEEYAGTGM
ncbi:MAG: HDOD domain-containing protein, partial [Planctomycetota bacterium]